MKIHTRILVLIFFLAIFCAKGQDKRWSSARPDGHAPIGVMGDHVHHKGEWMASYRYMNMNMFGNISGTEEVGFDTIFQKYMVAPQSMVMQMHMIGMMYAPSDIFTLYYMGSVWNNDMSLLTRTKLNFQTNSNGLGDVKLGSLIQLFNSERRTMHLNVGVSLPVGSITNEGVTPASDPEEVRLGYAMQLGSGTYDVTLGATYLKQYYNMSFGLQTTYLLRTGENVEGYTLGNTWNSTFWMAYYITKNFSASARLNYDIIDAINGADKTFNPMIATVYDAKNSGKRQLNFSVGGNMALFKGDLKGLRLSGEFGIPLYQYVEGIQMESKFLFTMGVQYAFGGH